ncbi:hypothetical protein R9C00_17320 [Flammeovirgaceae bacterium SG7u.111]|nr:hypothetical protein [Flammeovirgaceae bacterium SG7u.132]WPO33463.1 hypothetical protein R9C00_17320 [Flammeovirgaceae bacterium SG7u.111]
MRDKEILFNSRYTYFFERAGGIEVVLKPNYWIVIFLLSVFVGLLYASVSYYEGLSLMMKVIFLSFFNLLILHGVLRAMFMYPFLFTQKEVVYRKNLWVRFKSVKRKFEQIDYLEFKELDEKKIVLSVVVNGRRDEIMFLYLGTISRRI